MRATVTMILIGWLLGAATFTLGASLTANWYEYRILTDERLDTAINQHGWEPVPGQPERFLVRRARLRLP